MIWQDIVILIVNLVFTYTLIYQAHYGLKRKKGSLTLTTAGLTFVALYVVAIAFLLFHYIFQHSLLLLMEHFG